MNNKIKEYHMFNEQLSQQLSQSILDNKFSNEGIHIIPEKDNQISIK